jgi:serine/threonine-protein kinase
MTTAGRPDPQRVVALFEALSDCEPAQAERRLADECGGDDALRDAVHQVLLHDRAAPSGFLAPGPALLSAALRDFDPAETVKTSVGGDDEPLAGSSRLGRYYVLHKLAEGGMGVIYVGYDDALHRRVAIKVLRRGEAVSEWLRREGQALGRLSHPNVVSVHEVSEHEGRVFLAMELIEGPTLRAWLDAYPRPFADTLRLFLQAGRGLGAAHRAGLVHRDFKPENVIIGKDGWARVVDFGIVALAPGSPAEVPAISPTAPNALSSPLTQSGVLMGTPAFMSPEQFSGERPTQLSDQFSFCVALYRAAYGTSPHPAAELSQLAHSVLNDPPAPPPRRLEVPAWLAPILRRGLERDPSLRFASMDTLLMAIEGHLPRDPELDQTPVMREKRRMGSVFIACVVLSLGPMLSDACARVLMRPAGLIAVPSILLLITVSAVAWWWRGLSRNRHGRLFAGLFPSVLLALLCHRLIALRLGHPAEQILVEDMVLFATVWGVLAQTFSPWFGWLAVFTAVPAIVGALLPQRVPLLLGVLGLMGIVALVIRMFVDRHLRPEATVGPYENPQNGVGSSPVSADVE